MSKRKTEFYTRPFQTAFGPIVIKKAPDWSAWCHTRRIGMNGGHKTWVTKVQTNFWSNCRIAADFWEIRSIIYNFLCTSQRWEAPDEVLMSLVANLVIFLMSRGIKLERNIIWFELLMRNEEILWSYIEVIIELNILVHWRKFVFFLWVIRLLGSTISYWILNL